MKSHFRADSVSLTILHATVVQPQGLTRSPLSMRQGRIALTSPAGARELDWRDHLIFPGLVNAHDHLHLNNIPPLPGDRTFANSYDWIDAFKSHSGSPAVAAACAIPRSMRLWQGALKNLLSGTTTVAHHDPWEETLDNPDFPVRLVRRYGWCHSLRLGGIARIMLQWHYGPSVIESFAATPPGYPWFIHLAEGTDAVAAAELTQLVSLGFLQANTVLVHGVGLTDKDIDLVMARGARLVWCPGSNMSLLGATIKPRRLFAAGRLCLGTDSRLSGSQDLLAELGLAATYSDLSYAELISLATTASSRALGLPKVGGLQPGQYADMLIVRDGGGDPYASLIGLKRRDIRAVVRGGLPALADLDFAEMFKICGVKAVKVELDGRPKLAAAALLGPEGTAALEPGFTVMGSSGAD
jgi:cytosine/adenosine deaminase-related metal-dependent hydrolase